ncbi:hypothetical protein [Streptomyces sediminimaris]|uniref:hypothetical protein n=1 Tax=Streptomyces sediminimaris TaxID=3383721 RepID=UPI003999E9B3
MKKRALGADVCAGRPGSAVQAGRGDAHIECLLFSSRAGDQPPPPYREPGPGLTAYGVLAQGMPTGTRQPSAGHARHRGHLSRSGAGDIKTALAPVERLREIATARGATPARLAIERVLAQGRARRDILACVGAGRPRPLTKAVDAAGLRLTGEGPDTVEQTVSRRAGAGGRHAPTLLALLDGERTGGER